MYTCELIVQVMTAIFLVHLNNMQLYIIKDLGNLLVFFRLSSLCSKNNEKSQRLPFHGEIGDIRINYVTRKKKDGLSN